MTAYAGYYEGIDGFCEEAPSVNYQIAGNSESIVGFCEEKPGFSTSVNAIVLIPETIWYFYKRGWRTESGAYVYWTSTDRASAYPGGGTVDPVAGVVLRKYTQ